MSISFRESKKIGKNSKITLSPSGLSFGTKNKVGSANVNSKGRLSVNIKTPIKGLNYRRSISLFDLFKKKK